MKKINPKLPIVVNKKIPPKEGFFFVMVGGGPVVPIDIDGLIFWSKAEILPRNDWSTPDFQLNNEVGLPDLQLKTGSGIDFKAATSDQVTFPLITLTGDYTVVCYFDIQGTTAFKAIGRNNSGDNLLQITSNSFNPRHSGEIQDFPDIYTLDQIFSQIVFRRSGSNYKIYQNGVVVYNTYGDMSTNDISLNAIAVSITNAYRNQKNKDLAFFNSALTESQISNLYNNPQRFIELSRQYGADRIYPLSEDSFLNNSTVYDYSGNNQHGTFLTNAAGAYDAAINNLETGLQKGLHSYNDYLVFDGVDDYEDDSNNLTSAVWANDWTLELDISNVNNAVYFVNADNNQLFVGLVSNKFIVGTGTGWAETVDNFITPSGKLIIKHDTSKVGFERVSFNLNGVDLPTQLNTTWTNLTTRTIVNFGRRTIGTNYVKGLFNYKLYSDLTETNLVFKRGDGTIFGSPNKVSILSPTPTGTTDILGNPISTPWKSGIINFGDYVHGGGTIGSTIDSLDAANRTILIGFHYKVTDKVQNLLINRSSGDGFLLLLTSSNRVSYDNKIASVNQLRVGLTDLLDDNKYIAAITHASDGTAQLYLMNVTLDEAVMSTDNTSANIGAVGLGSEIPVIGNLVSGTLPTNFPITPPLVFARVLTLSELNNSANFLKTTI